MAQGLPVSRLRRLQRSRRCSSSEPGRLRRDLHPDPRRRALRASRRGRARNRRLERRRRYGALAGDRDGHPASAHAQGEAPGLARPPPGRRPALRGFLLLPSGRPEYAVGEEVVVFAIRAKRGTSRPPSSCSESSASSATRAGGSSRCRPCGARRGKKRWSFRGARSPRRKGRRRGLAAGAPRPPRLPGRDSPIPRAPAASCRAFSTFSAMARGLPLRLASPSGRLPLRWAISSPWSTRSRAGASPRCGRTLDRTRAVAVRFGGSTAPRTSGIGTVRRT